LRPGHGYWLKDRKKRQDGLASANAKCENARIAKNREKELCRISLCRAESTVSCAESLLIAFSFEWLVGITMVSHAFFIVCNGFVALTFNFPKLAQAVVKVRDGWVLAR